MRVLVCSLQVTVLWIVCATALNDTTTDSPMITTSDGSYCHVSWRRYGQSCYLHITDKLDFSQANASCNENGHLVSISDKEENDFVMSLSNSTDTVWIGLYHQTENCRNHSLCDWMWTDGSELGYMNWLPSGIPAFPNCAFINSNGIWGNNQVCNGRLDFICERSVWFHTTTPVETTMMTTAHVVDRSTTVVNASPTVESNEEYDDGDDMPIIIGCVVGGLVLVAIIAVVAVVLLKRHRTSSQADQPVEDKDEETPPVAKRERYNPGYEDVETQGETQGETNVTFKPSPDNTDTGAHGVGDNPHQLYSEPIKKKDRPGSKGILVKENTLYGSGK